MSQSKKAVEGIKWNYLSMIGLVAAQLSFAAIFSRLLDPAAFGLMAMANLMIKFGSYFSASGVRTYLIRKPSLDESDIEASFWLSGAFGLILAGLAFMFASVAGNVFNSVAVEPVIRVMAVLYVFTGFSITSSALLNRALRFKAISVAELLCYCAGYLLIGIPMALMEYGVYSLVSAMLANQFLLMIAYYWLSPHKLGIRSGAKRLKRVLRTGTHYSFNSILDFTVNSMPTFMIGRSLGEVLLGVFNRANMLVTLPTNNLSAAVSRVFFPLIASLQSDRQKLKELYMKGSILISLVMFPLCIGMIPAASELVLVVLGAQWESGVPVFQVLAIAMMFHFASIFPGQYADAHGFLRARTVIQVVTIFVMLAAILALLDHGLVGVSIGFAVGQIFRFIVFLLCLRKWLRFTLSDYAAMYLPGIAIGILSGLGVYIVHVYLQLTPLIFTLIAEIVVGIAIYCTLLLFLPFRKMREALLHLLQLISCDANQGRLCKVVGYVKIRLGQ